MGHTTCFIIKVRRSPHHLSYLEPMNYTVAHVPDIASTRESHRPTSEAINQLRAFAGF